MQITVKGEHVLRGLHAFLHKRKAAVHKQVMRTGVAMLDVYENACLAHSPSFANEDGSLPLKFFISISQKTKNAVSAAA